MTRAIRGGIGLWAAAIVCLLISAGSAAGQKTDVVVLANGDTFTCEIKELVRGRLRVSTDSMGTIMVEWEDVRQLTSSSRFEVELDSGVRHIGSFGATTAAARLGIIGDTGRAEHDHLTVVRITPMGSAWLERIDGSLDFGFNFTKANEARQWSLAGDATRRGERFGISLDFNSLFTSQDGIENTSRQVLDVQIQRFLPKRWVLAVLTQLQQNEELQLELRSTASVGAGRYLVQSNHTLLALLGGVSLTRERFIEPDSASSNMEALAVLDFQTFRFDDPETDIGATVSVAPGLTDAGRVRVDFTTHIRREILTDFYWNVSFFDNYDSAPGSAGAQRNDYGLISSFGWKF